MRESYGISDDISDTALPEFAVRGSLTSPISIAYPHAWPCNLAGWQQRERGRVIALPHNAVSLYAVPDRTTPLHRFWRRHLNVEDKGARISTFHNPSFTDISNTYSFIIDGLLPTIVPYSIPSSLTRKPLLPAPWLLITDGKNPPLIQTSAT